MTPEEMGARIGGAFASAPESLGTLTLCRLMVGDLPKGTIDGMAMIGLLVTYQDDLDGGGDLVAELTQHLRKLALGHTGVKA